MGSGKNSCKTAAVMSLIAKKPARSATEIIPEPGAALGAAGDREQIEYINIDRLEAAPNNFYDLSGLDGLAANIELVGLQQPLRVRPKDGVPGQYVIVSGHRRLAAVRRLVEDGRGELRDVQCIVERNQGSAAFLELRLIYANSDTRKMTSFEMDKQAQRIEALLYQLKEEGFEFPGRMRDLVAEVCKVSKSKLARLAVIRKNLDERWQTGWEKGKLAESAAYALAQMPRERQRVIFDGLKKQGEYPSSVYESTVSRYGKMLVEAEAVECKTYGKGPCLNLENMRKRIMAGHTGDYNRCRQCCGECDKLVSCKYACPMLAERIKALKADAKAQRQQEKQAAEERERPKAEQRRALWKRFGEARAAAGVSPEECYRAGGMYYCDRGGDGDAYGKLERLEGKFGTDIMLPYGRGCYLSDVQGYVKLADLLGVSLDYLLCRTDNPAGLVSLPESQMVICAWMPGRTLPFQPCDVVADFAWGGGPAERRPCWFDGKGFRVREGGKPIKAEPVRWMVLPPVEDAVNVPESGTREATP